MPYASRTGTRRNLDALREAGWGLLVSCMGAQRDEGFDTICVDNPAYPLFLRGEVPDDAVLEQRFVPTICRFGAKAQFVVAPDIVCGGPASLELTRRWLPRVLQHTRRALIGVQDGMVVGDVRDLISDRVGIFVGGGGDWKEQSLPMWRDLKRETGCYLHVARVNTARRVALCAAYAADSFDGTSASRFSKTLPLIDNARHQRDLFA